MRPGIVLPLLLVGALALAAGVWLSLRRNALPAEPPLVVTGAEASVATVPAASAPAPVVRVLPAPAAASAVSAAAAHEAYVDARCAELVDLAMDDKPESLANILGELTNRDPDIRQAARNAAVQFGSREAIPRLMEAVDQTDDPDEKAALFQAIKFLKLPTLSERAEQAKTNALAGNR